MDLEERFQEEMLRIYREATKFGYYPTYFLQNGQRTGRFGNGQTIARR